MTNLMIRKITLTKLSLILILLAGFQSAGKGINIDFPVFDIPPDPPTVTRDSIIGPDRACVGDIADTCPRFDIKVPVHAIGIKESNKSQQDKPR